MASVRVSDKLKEDLIKSAERHVEYFTQRQNRGAVATGPNVPTFKDRVSASRYSGTLSEHNPCVPLKIDPVANRSSVLTLSVLDD